MSKEEGSVNNSAEEAALLLPEDSSAIDDASQYKKEEAAETKEATGASKPQRRVTLISLAAITFVFIAHCRVNLIYFYSRRDSYFLVCGGPYGYVILRLLHNIY